MPPTDRDTPRPRPPAWRLDGPRAGCPAPRVDTESTLSGSGSRHPGAPVVDATMLVITWYPSEPARVGEVLMLPDPAAGVTATLGRGEGDGLSLRLVPTRQRPGRHRTGGPLTDRRLSRDQLALRAAADGHAERPQARAPWPRPGSGPAGPQRP